MVENIKKNLLPSLVVFLVALPLCMGIAIASGIPAISGLLTGVVGGVIVGLISGSPLQVSGPAAGLTVIVWQFVEKFGLAGLAYIVLFAGMIQILMGALKLGQIFRAIPPSIIQGMLAGIGTLIVLSQWHVMLDSSPLSSGFKNLTAIPQSISFLALNSEGVSRVAFFTGLLAIVLMLLWPKLAPKKLRIIPSSLIAVTAITVLTVFFSTPVKHIEIPFNLVSALQPISFKSFASFSLFEIVIASLTLAFVATAETLLSAGAVDQMHHGARTKYDKELIAQGVGNSLCGLFGGLPMTGVIVRSGANVQAGATSRASTIMHGLWILLFVLVFPTVLRQIPVSALAAVLILTGYKLVNYKYVKSLWVRSKTEVGIFAVTYFTIVFVDLLKGILVGLLLAIAKLLFAVTHLEIQYEKGETSGRANLRLKGAATFMGLPKIAQILDQVPADMELYVHIQDVSIMDHACIELFENTKARFESKGGRLIME